MENTSDQTKVIDKSHERFVAAERTSVGIGIEIGTLDGSDINEKTAPFLAGIMIAREIERIYLESYSTYFNDGTKILKEATKASRENTGRVYDIYRQARAGNTLPLKNFLEEQAELFEDMSKDYAEGEREPAHDEYQKASENIRLVAEMLSDQADVDAIKIPPPAWMEEPIPLKIQLEQLRQGGDN